MWVIGSYTETGMPQLVCKVLWTYSPMSEDRKRELNSLAERPDSEIDLSEIPPLSDRFWKNAIRNPYVQRPQVSADSKED